MKLACWNGRVIKGVNVGKNHVDACNFMKMYVCNPVFKIFFKSAFNMYMCMLNCFQSNSFPERNLVYDFCFEKRASGNWIDWMDTLDKSTMGVPADATVRG